MRRQRLYALALVACLSVLAGALDEDLMLEVEASTGAAAPEPAKAAPPPAPAPPAIPEPLAKAEEDEEEKEQQRELIAWKSPIPGLDTVGSGYSLLRGERTAAVFEWRSAKPGPVAWEPYRSFRIPFQVQVRSLAAKVTQSSGAYH